jgi:hypothetical protein
MPWPLVQHSDALADRQPYARPMLGRPLEEAPRLVEARPVPAPLLDLVEIAAVGVFSSEQSVINGIFAALFLGQEAKQQHNEPERHKDDDQADHVRTCAQQAR